MLRVNGWIAVVLFAWLTAVVGLQVVNRLVLHWPIIWSEEVARFLFFWVVLLGAAASVRRRRHFVIDLGYGRPLRRGPLGLLLTVLPDLCIFAFSAFLLVQGLDYTRVGWSRTATNSGVNMGVVYGAIPVFAGLSLVYAAINLASDYRTYARGGSVDVPAPTAE
jgi:TRAP-type C4-dicarboxylate transport system permease small subunit